MAKPGIGRTSGVAPASGDVQGGHASHQPLISVGSDNVVKATVNASTHIRVEGQYIQNQNVYHVQSVGLDLQAQLKGQSEQVKVIGVAVQRLLEQHQLHRREVRPADSLSIRNEQERQLVKQLVARYRALPEGQRRQVPALLAGIGKLEVVAGNFAAAQEDFQLVAAMVEDKQTQAEAHFNAYRAALENRDWAQAFKELRRAIRGDAKRFLPFPMARYLPERILGAGGFGVAFLCKHQFMDAQVVVKALQLEDLGQDADRVFTEAQVLGQLDHPAVIRVSDCGYMDPATKSRPYIVMDYFEGKTLEDQVKQQGPLSVGDLLPIARQIAEGLHAAHTKSILHRDLKPANVLVRRGGSDWKVKVIDFGLAMRQKAVQKTRDTGTSKHSKTLVGESIAGSLDYAAPEQIGRRPGPVGPYSDVFGWAKTCCYALFQTPQPLPRHWQSIPPPMARLLGECLEEDPKKRPANFQEVLAQLTPAPEKPLEVVPAEPDPLTPLPLEEASTNRGTREPSDQTWRVKAARMISPSAAVKVTGKGTAIISDVDPQTVFAYLVETFTDYGILNFHLDFVSLFVQGYKGRTKTNPNFHLDFVSLFVLDFVSLFVHCTLRDNVLDQ